MRFTMMQGSGLVLSGDLIWRERRMCDRARRVRARLRRCVQHIVCPSSSPHRLVVGPLFFATDRRRGAEDGHVAFVCCGGGGGRKGGAHTSAPRRLLRRGRSASDFRRIECVWPAARIGPLAVRSRVQCHMQLPLIIVHLHWPASSHREPLKTHRTNPIRSGVRDLFAFDPLQGHLQRL